jgi:hypothetical protein
MDGRWHQGGTGGRDDKADTSARARSKTAQQRAFIPVINSHRPVWLAPLLKLVLTESVSTQPTYSNNRQNDAVLTNWSYKAEVLKFNLTLIESLARRK